MTNDYSMLLQDSPLVLADSKRRYVYLTERHLQAVWFEQKLFGPLKTIDGEQVSVVSPGIWNQDAGPDFLKAHVRIGNRDVIGDIELHLTPRDWYHHGHHQDSRYNHVALHVSLWKTQIIQPIISPCGKEIPQIAIEPFLSIQTDKLADAIDLELYPYKSFLGSGKCATGLFNQLPRESILKFFQSASQWRLLQKSKQLSYIFENCGVAFQYGMARALGYKNNADVFGKLFLWLHSMKERGEELVLALALGACGIFEQRCESSYFQRLRTLYLSERNETDPQFKLDTFRVRPLNHPVRRLASLAKLITDPTAALRYFTLDQLWLSHQDFTSLKNKLIESIPCYEDPYWNTHYLFESKQQPKKLPLIGHHLKQEIIINVVLPLIFHSVYERADVNEIERFSSFYHTFCAAKNSKSRYLTHRFFGDSENGDVFKKADIEQGAYQLHRDFCLSYEASCEGCPFIDKYRKKLK